MNRKAFLRSFAIAAAATLKMGSPKGIFSQNSFDPDKTLSSRILSNTAIILGGGLSGLYSAYLLKKKGIRVRIVEASSRLGGRILSFKDPSTGLVGDLGGEFVGEKQSTIRSLLRELDLNLQSPQWSQSDALWESGKLSEKSKVALEKLLSLQSKLPPEQIQGLDRISLYRYLRYQGFAQDELEFLDRVVRGFFGESSKNLSSHFLLSCIDSNRSYFQKLYRIEGGAESLIQRLQSTLREDEIVLSDPAVKVSRNSVGFQVELASGMILRSRSLICTLPAYAVPEIQWIPSLPREKIFALLRVGYGSIRKEVVYVENPVGSPQEGSGIVDWVLPLKGNAMTVVSTGGKVSVFEKSPLGMTRDILFRSLTPHSPRSSETLEISREGFGRGSVSVFTPSTYGLKEILETSVGNIHFAGEYIPEISGTMDAALVSAFRAVARV